MGMEREEWEADRTNERIIKIAGLEKDEKNQWRIFVYAIFFLKILTFLLPPLFSLLVFPLVTPYESLFSDHPIRDQDLARPETAIPLCVVK
jgi:hypothetical protein